MKITRRTFLGAAAATILTASDALGFFRKKKALRHEAAVDYLKAHTQGEPHKSCTYIYNAGMDYDGDIRRHTFGNYGMLPGGKVTRITQCEEWTLRGLHELHTEGKRIYAPVGRFGRMLGMKPRMTGYKPSEGEWKRMQGLYRTERVKTGAIHSLGYDSLKHTNPGLASKYLLTPESLTDAERHVISTSWYEEPLYEDRYVIVHPAREIADGLKDLGSDRYMQLTVLSFWDDTEVDVDWVNSLIVADTLQKRIERVSALRNQREHLLLKLRAALLPALAEHTKALRTCLSQNMTASAEGQRGFMSQYEAKACSLLGMTEKDWQRIVTNASLNEWGPDVAWIEQALPLWK